MIQFRSLRNCFLFQLLFLLLCYHLGVHELPLIRAYIPPNTVQPPAVSPATNLPNKIYTWRKHQIRYQMAGDLSAPHAVVLVHGLFVNSDHWRKTLRALSTAGYRAYAIDLLGYGYSSKPSPSDRASSQLVCGEQGRFLDDSDFKSDENLGSPSVSRKRKYPSVLRDVSLGTADGGSRIAKELELRHPVASPYNFFTWAEQIADFTRDVVLADNLRIRQSAGSLYQLRSNSITDTVTLVANSIGTISSLQSVLDCPELYNGVFVVNPNFRELHSAEVAFSKITMPLIRSVQALLRSKGQGLFNLLAKPSIVKQILLEPYAVREAVDDELVEALLTPLLLPGASDIVFDTLSYSAGPLPEQQLRDEHFPKDTVPVWICYGSKDPWTPPARVEKLKDIASVERVVRLDGLGHCPHDEVIDPGKDIVSPLLFEFLERVRDRQAQKKSMPA